MVGFTYHYHENIGKRVQQYSADFPGEEVEEVIEKGKPAMNVDKEDQSTPPIDMQVEEPSPSDEGRESNAVAREPYTFFYVIWKVAYDLPTKVAYGLVNGVHAAFSWWLCQTYIFRWEQSEVVVQKRKIGRYEANPFSYRVVKKAKVSHKEVTLQSDWKETHGGDAAYYESPSRLWRFVRLCCFFLKSIGLYIIGKKLYAQNLSFNSSSYEKILNTAVDYPLYISSNLVNILISPILKTVLETITELLDSVTSSFVFQVIIIVVVIGLLFSVVLYSPVFIILSSIVIYATYDKATGKLGKPTRINAATIIGIGIFIALGICFYPLFFFYVGTIVKIAFFFYLLKLSPSLDMLKKEPLWGDVIKPTIDSPFTIPHGCYIFLGVFFLYALMAEVRYLWDVNYIKEGNRLMPQPYYCELEAR